VTGRVSGLRRSLEHAGAALDRFVTQREAAELTGRSKDTIVRARQAGRFPHARLDGHTWTIPTADLVAAGLYDPAAPARPVVTDPAPATEDTTPDPLALARAEARIGALEDLVARQDAELAFLRQLTTDTLSRKAS
jgi:excisionase family DNA binding protein